VYCWRPDCYSAAPPAGSSSVAVAKTDTYGQLGDQSWSATHKVRLWVDMNPVPGRKGEHSWHNMQSQQNIVQPTACGRNCKAISQTCTVIGHQAEKYLQNCSGASRVSSSQHNTCSALQRSNQGVQPWNPEQIPLTQRVYHLIRKKKLAAHGRSNTQSTGSRQCSAISTPLTEQGRRARGTVTQPRQTNNKQFKDKPTSKRYAQERRKQQGPRRCACSPNGVQRYFQAIEALRGTRDLAEERGHEDSKRRRFRNYIFFFLCCGRCRSKARS